MKLLLEAVGSTHLLPLTTTEETPDNESLFTVVLNSRPSADPVFL